MLQSLWVKGFIAVISLSSLTSPMPTTLPRAKCLRVATGAGCLHVSTVATLIHLSPTSASSSSSRMSASVNSTILPSTCSRTCTPSPAHRIAPASIQQCCQCEGLLPPLPWLDREDSPVASRNRTHLPPSKFSHNNRECDPVNWPELLPSRPPN